MLLDSNSIIYSIKPEFGNLRKLIAQHNPAVSAISYVEYWVIINCLKLINKIS